MALDLPMVRRKQFFILLPIVLSQIEYFFVYCVKYIAKNINVYCKTVKPLRNFKIFEQLRQKEEKILPLPLF